MKLSKALKKCRLSRADKETKNIVDWLVDLGIEPSKRQAREDITKGAISMNGEKVADVEFRCYRRSCIGGSLLLFVKVRKIIA